MSKVYLRYKQTFKDKASEATFEVCFTSPKEFQKDRESKFPFPVKEYEIDLEHEFEAEGKISEIMKKVEQNIVQLCGETPCARGIFCVHDDGTFEDFPRHITYLSEAAWPMRGEDATVAQKKANKRTIERNKKLLETYNEIRKQNEMLPMS